MVICLFKRSLRLALQSIEVGGEVGPTIVREAVRRERERSLGTIEQALDEHIGEDAAVGDDLSLKGHGGGNQEKGKDRSHVSE